MSSEKEPSATGDVSRNPNVIEATSPASINAWIENNKSVIKLGGDIDLYVSGMVRRIALLHIEKETDELVFDLGETEFIDSTALGVFIGAHKRTIYIGRKGLRLCNVTNRNISKIFEMQGLDRVFVIEPDMDLEKNIDWEPIFEGWRRKQKQRRAEGSL